MESSAYNSNIPPFARAPLDLAAVLDTGAEGTSDLEEDEEEDDEEDEDSLTMSPRKCTAPVPGKGLHDGDMGGELRDARGEASLGKHLPPRLRQRATEIQRTLGSTTMLNVTRTQSYYGSPGCAEMVRLAAQLLL